MALAALIKTDPFKKLISSDLSKSNIRLVGGNKTLIPFIIATLAKKTAKETVFVFSDDIEFENFVDKWGERIYRHAGVAAFFRGEHSVPGLRKGLHESLVSYKGSLFDGGAQATMTTRGDYIYLLNIMPGLSSGKLFRVGDSISIKKLESILKKDGYERVDGALNTSEYSIRGGIVDFFPNHSNDPVRFEYAGNTISSIRIFSVVDQLSIHLLDEYRLIPKQHYNNTSAENANDRSLKNQIISVFIDCSTWVVSINDNGASKMVEIDLNTRMVSHRDIKTILNQGGVDNICISLGDGFSSCMVDGSLILDAGGSVMSNRNWENKPPTGFVGVNGSSFLESINIGDPVLHKFHGVGLFRGLDGVATKSGDLVENIIIEYNDGGLVFVPVDKLNNVYPSPYKKSVGDSLFRGSWKKRYRSAEGGAREVAASLINLYTIRNKNKGRKYTLDKELGGAIASSFPYRLTGDQEKALKEVLFDLQQPKPMNRLLVGDVGFGKTEIMLRASGFVVGSGYQVIILAPTTLLADQHYFLFKSRLEPIGIRIGLLSRFAGKKQKNDLVDSFIKQKTDIIIGTHGVLNANIISSSVGLVIVDEEHRFGSKQKDRVLLKHPLLDLLTVSATPLPRTVQKSLEGFLPASALSEPPPGRLSTTTRIKYFDYSWVAWAIENEIRSGGRAMVVQNSINKLSEYGNQIEKLVDGSKVDIIHGRMSSKSLEEAFLRFFAGETNVICGTTIVESGLDIPDVNTIIICDAHKYGLAQLHQLRGRVGRSTKRSYCYLSVPKKTKLSPGAYLRLRSINENCYLGSGFNISQQDLDVRGPGDIFGHKQSGNIKNVGYPLFLDLLEKALGRDSKPEPDINIECPQLIPHHYITNDSDRLSFYARIAGSRSYQQLADIGSALKDRFGPLPKEVELMLISKKASISMQKSRLVQASINSARIKLEPSADSRVSLERLFVFNRSLEKIERSNSGLILYPNSPSIEKNIQLFINLSEQVYG